jgi:hypothetical protein
MPKTFSYAEKRAAIRKMIGVLEQLKRERAWAPLFDDEDIVAKMHSAESDFMQRRLPWDQPNVDPPPESRVHNAPKA